MHLYCAYITKLDYLAIYMQKSAPSLVRVQTYAAASAAAAFMVSATRV